MAAAGVVVFLLATCSVLHAGLIQRRHATQATAATGTGMPNMDDCMPPFPPFDGNFTGGPPPPPMNGNFTGGPPSAANFTGMPPWQQGGQQMGMNEKCFPAGMPQQVGRSKRNSEAEDNAAVQSDRNDGQNLPPHGEDKDSHITRRDVDHSGHTGNGNDRDQPPRQDGQDRHITRRDVDQSGQQGNENNRDQPPRQDGHDRHITRREVSQSGRQGNSKNRVQSGGVALLGQQGNSNNNRRQTSNAGQSGQQGSQSSNQSGRHGSQASSHSGQQQGMGMNLKQSKHSDDMGGQQSAQGMNHGQQLHLNGEDHHPSRRDVSQIAFHGENRDQSPPQDNRGHQ